MIKKVSIKRLLIGVCVLVLGVSMVTGCGKSKKHGSKTSDDGRSYDGLISVKQDETIHTAFFDLSVDDVKKYNTYQFMDGLYKAEEGTVYLLVTVTIQNTYAENLSMGITDFTIDYEGNEKDNIIYGYGKADIGKEELMDNLFSLKTGDSITKSILYIVPDKEIYSFDYTEYYADDFVGDTFCIELTPQLSEPVTTEATTVESTAQNTAATEGVTEEEAKVTEGASEE